MSRAKLSAIIECFEAHGDLSVSELCEKLDTTIRSARAAVHSLVDSGFLEVIPAPTTQVWDHEDLDISVKYRLTKLGRG